jgi:hypothetical protein
MRSMDSDDFYEDDEPVEEIMAAFERGEKGVTAPPSHGVNETIIVPGLRPILTQKSSNRPNSLLASCGN